MSKRSEAKTGGAGLEGETKTPSYELHRKADDAGVRLVEKVLFAILSLLLALAVLGQANPALKTPARDSGFYLYIGDQILEGRLPYRDAWESKPPAIFYLNAFALWLGGGTRWGLWAVEMLSLLAAVGISFRLMNRLWGAWAALFGLLAWVYGLNGSLLGGNFTEEYPLPLHFLALSLFPALTGRRPSRLLNFLLGFISGACLLFRPNNAVVEAAMVLTLVVVQLSGRNPRGLAAQLAWVAAGTALPLVITGTYFWAHGLLRDLLEGSLLYNLVYSGTTLTSSSPLVYGSRILGASVWIAAAGYLAAALRLWAPSGDKWLCVLLLIGWPMAILLSDPARRNYAHYYMNWLPFMGLLAAVGFHTVQRLALPWLKDSPALRLGGLGAAVALTLIFIQTHGIWDDYQRAVRRLSEPDRPGVESISPLAAYVNEHTQPGEQVLFWGAYPGENFMSKRDSPSGVLFYPLYVKSEISRRLEDRFLQELRANRPALIVDMGDEWALSLDPAERERRRAAGVGWSFLPSNIDQVFAFIDGNYFLEKRFRGMSIYRLKGPGG